MTQAKNYVVAGMLNAGMWHSILTTLQHWPWGSIAAFGAVGVAIWSTQASTRERRRQMQQQAIIDVVSQSNVLLAEMGSYMGAIRDYVTGAVLKLPARSDGDRLLAACAAMDKTLKSATMVITDEQLASKLTQATLLLKQFLGVITKTPGSNAAKRDGLPDVLQTGLVLINDFTAAMTFIHDRGFDEYRFALPAIVRLRRRLVLSVTRRWPEK